MNKYDIDGYTKGIMKLLPILHQDIIIDKQNGR